MRVTRKIRRIGLAIHALDRAWGFTICRETGLGPGTVYPVLERLREAGWIGTQVEEQPPAGRPPRTFYHLTLRGQMGLAIDPAPPESQAAARR